MLIYNNNNISFIIIQYIVKIFPHHHHININISFFSSTMRSIVMSALLLPWTRRYCFWPRVTRYTAAASTGKMWKVPSKFASRVVTFSLGRKALAWRGHFSKKVGALFSTLGAQSGQNMEIEKPFKKSFLFTIGYNGKPFHGNTYQTNKSSKNLPTVEKEILQALEKTLVGPAKIPVKIPVPQCNVNDMSKYPGVPTIKRTSRTDKGVSCRLGAITLRAQLPSESYIVYNNETRTHYVHQDVIDQINDNLSENVRIFNIMKTKNKNDLRKACVARTYEYYLPMRVFNMAQGHDCNETVDAACVEEIINKLNRVLGLFVGTKRMNCFGKNRGAHHVRMFHTAMQDKYQNEAKGGTIVNGEEHIDLDGTFISSDGERRSNIYHVPREEILYRTIYSCFCEEAVSIGPKHTFLKIVLTGNSFIYNQIRYMVGLAVAVVRGDVPLKYLEIALNGRVGVTLPKAPACGLLLHSYVFRPKIPHDNQ